MFTEFLYGLISVVIMILAFAIHVSTVFVQPLIADILYFTVAGFGFIFHFLLIRFNMCFGCSKKKSHGNDSFDYPQHMFWMRNKKKKILIWA